METNIQLLYFKEREELDRIRKVDSEDKDLFMKDWAEALKRDGIIHRRVVKKKSSELILAAFNNWSATC